MATNISVFLIAMATFQIAFGVFRALESLSFEKALFSLVLGLLWWSIGAVSSRLITGLHPIRMRWMSCVTIALAAAVLPWIGVGIFGWILLGLAAFMSGVFLPTHIRFVENTETLRETYGRLLFGMAAGALICAIIEPVFGVGAIFSFSAATVAVIPFLQSDLFFESPTSQSAKLKFVTLPIAALFLVLVGITPEPVPESSVESKGSSAMPTSYGNELVFSENTPDAPRKSDVLIAGSGVIEHLRLISDDVLKAQVRSLTLIEENHKLASLIQEFQAPEGIEVVSRTGDVRRYLRSQNRRFDVIQILTPADLGLQIGKTSVLSPDQARVTVESVKLYIDRLKEDGVLHFPRAIYGDWAQSLMATLAEAWKKSARPNVNLHVLGYADAQPNASHESQSRQVQLKTALVRLKAFMKEDRDAAEKALGIRSVESGAESNLPYQWVLATDGSGEILTDDRPMVSSNWTTGTVPIVLLLMAGFGFILLVLWIVSQDRRKEIKSRWQTLSVAAYFGGLGISFAFFQVFFVLKAIRTWGAPSLALSLSLSAIFISLALGSGIFGTHPKRRHGVRIQSLANFVFALLFTYLAAALFEPLMNSSPIWLSFLIGLSILMPFGILGGSFFPNALEEASEKLPPRAISMLWGLHIIGAGLGAAGGAYVALTYGLDLAYLAGLFCFAWVAISSGLIRPWSVRKSAKVDT